MEFPSWFQNAIQRRLDQVSAQVQRYPELCKSREEEKTALHAMFPGVDTTQMPAYIEWEDKHHFTQALENERLYLQGMRDGVQLVFALISDPIPSDEVLANSKKSELKSVKYEAGSE